MTDYEYIIAQCQKFCKSLWNEGTLKECIDKIKTLSDKELCGLLCANELHADRNWEAFPDYSLEDITEHCKRQMELKSAIVQAMPTTKLVEIINSFYEDYKRNNDCLASMDCETFSQACKLTSEELRRRYLADIDCKIIEQAFNHKHNKNKVWIEWQLRKQKLAEIRYQDSFFKNLKDKEIFADEEFVYHGIHGYDTVVSIKVCRTFWDEDKKRIGAIDFILKACGVVPQYIGLGDEVVFAVASDDYELENAFEYKQEYRNSRLRAKIDKIFEKEYDKDLVLGCLLVEKFIRIVAPESSAKVKCYDKDYLLGHFVIECPNELFTTINTIADFKYLTPKAEKDLNAFIGSIKEMMEVSWKNGSGLDSFPDLVQDSTEPLGNLPF